MRRLRYYLWRTTIFLMPLGLMACGPREKITLPPPPAETVVAKVPVPVPCEIKQIPKPDYPARTARKGDDIFTLAKTAAADRRVRIGETEQLRAANQTPCPGAN